MINVRRWFVCALLIATSYLHKTAAKQDDELALWQRPWDHAYFESWWKDNREALNVPVSLKDMVNHFIASGSIKECSKFWNYLNAIHIADISAHGYQNFKQTVAKNYYTFLENEDGAMSRALNRYTPQKILDINWMELEKRHPLFTDMQSILFNRRTAKVLSYHVDLGHKPYLKYIEEPLIGNPPFISYQGIRITQDSLHSLGEYRIMKRHFALPHDVVDIADGAKPAAVTTTFLEIGAGSGRTAHCILSVLPATKYIIADIPPALFLSQSYLSDSFPGKKIFQFRPFSNFDEIKEEFEEADIVFLMPSQLPLLPARSVDVFLAIDCLSEMKLKTIHFYFDQADRLARFFFYECWQKTCVPFDQIPLDMSSYPLKDHWEILETKACDMPDGFFYACVKTSR